MEEQFRLDFNPGEPSKSVFVPPSGYFERNKAYNEILAREEQGITLSDAEKAFKEKMREEYANEDRESRSKNHGG